MSGQADIDTKEAAAINAPSTREPGEWRKDFLAAFCIAMALFALYIIPTIRMRPLSETPEARVAVVAREMLKSGNYVVPTMGGEARLNKPPLPYWLAVGAAKVTGGAEMLSNRSMARAVQLPPAILGALAAFIVVLFGSMAINRTAGVWAGLILGLSMLVARFAQLGYGDTVLMCACAGMLCGAAWMVCSPQPGFFSALFTGICLGLAILTKGHIPVLLLAGVLLAESALRLSFDSRKVMLFAVAFVIAALVAVPWFYMLEQQNRGSLSKMFSEVSAGIAPVGHKQSDRYGYYFYRLAGGLLPWTPLLLMGWPIYLTKRRPSIEPSRQEIFAHQYLRFFLIAFGLGFLGFYAIAKQQDYYLLPILPALALASGYMLARFNESGGAAEEKLGWTQLLLGLFAGLFLMALPLMKDHIAEAAKTCPPLLSLNQFSAQIGWGVVAIGFCVLLLHFFYARQWAEGRSMSVSLAMAFVAYIGLLALSVSVATKNQNTNELYLEEGELRAQLDNFGKDTKIYAAGRSEELFTFYLQRPVETLRELPADMSDPNIKRVLVASQDTLKRHQLTQYAPADKNKTFVVISSLPTADWQRLAAEEQKREHGGD